jgi:hypothetical protein
MTYALVAYFFVAGTLQSAELATGLTYQECKTDLAALPPAPGIRLACEAET